MKAKIDLVTIITKDVPALVRFYRDVMGFNPKTDMGNYVEFDMEGVRFSVCHYSELQNATGNSSFQEPRAGQSFELAFLVDSARDVDRTYAEIISKGATPIREPANMPWGQRTAFFADPDGNIHEIFAELESQE